MTQEEKYPIDSGCFLHPSCAGDERRGIPACPEPICVYDFPGGPRAFLQYKELRGLLDRGMDIDMAAVELRISKSAAQRRFNKVKVLVNR